MIRRGFAVRCFLLLASAIALACDADDVVVLRLPGAMAGMPGAGMAGVGGMSGEAGAGSSNGGISGTDTGGQAGTTAGSPEGGNAGTERGGAAGAESAGTAGLAGMSGMSGMSGNAGAGGQGTCGSNEDCPPSRVCVKSGCADERGACEPEPLFCEPTPDPVCGCDDVTYWNDCVRRSAGVALSSEEQCGANALACDDASDCGVENAACSRLRLRGGIDMCPLGPGTCWVLPKDRCDPGDERRWVECVPPDAPLPPFPPPCIDTCTALRSGRSHIPARPDVIPCP